MKTINIIVGGGVILSVSDIPEGVEVLVKDFDCDLYPDEANESVEKTEDGDFYFKTLWGHTPKS